MRRISFLVLCPIIFILSTAVLARSVEAHGNKHEAPLRVALAGLVHGHASGFFGQFLKSPDLHVVRIAESDGQLVAYFEKKYSLEPTLFCSDLEKMLEKTDPQAVLAYTNTYDHRRVVEICARYGVPVMMEKPLAVSFEDARAIENAARGKDSGSGELRDDLVSQQSSGLRPGARKRHWRDSENCRA